MNGFLRYAALVTALTLLLVPSALGAAKSGSYKGKIEFQGYDVTFKVKQGKVTKLVARMLQDCDRDGISETFLIAPKKAFKIKGNKVNGKITDSYGQSKATVILKGKFTGSKFKGHVREYDSVAGSGIVCDTLNRKFTAKRK